MHIYLICMTSSWKDTGFLTPVGSEVHPTGWCHILSVPAPAVASGPTEQHIIGHSK